MGAVPIPVAPRPLGTKTPPSTPGAPIDIRPLAPDCDAKN